MGLHKKKELEEFSKAYFFYNWRKCIKGGENLHAGFISF
tara:strand:+ start:752 stop:868 length:117 start_codon:yes stop_codon:yes gene_type:complete